jgi:hypothetical protein
MNRWNSTAKIVRRDGMREGGGEVRGRGMRGGYRIGEVGGKRASPVLYRTGREKEREARLSQKNGARKTRAAGARGVSIN